MARSSCSSGNYPEGTIIQLVTTGAMVKRHSGWNRDTNDWEFFELSLGAAGTEILNRSTTDVVKQFGGNCFDCHSAAEPQFDLVCETTNGCAPLPIPTAILAATQDTDSRCR